MKDDTEELHCSDYTHHTAGIVFVSFLFLYMISQTQWVSIFYFLLLINVEGMQVCNGFTAF